MLVCWRESDRFNLGRWIRVAKGFFIRSSSANSSSNCVSSHRLVLECLLKWLEVRGDDWLLFSPEYVERERDGKELWYLCFDFSIESVYVYEKVRRKYNSLFWLNEIQEKKKKRTETFIEKCYTCRPPSRLPSTCGALCNCARCWKEERKHKKVVREAIIKERQEMDEHFKCSK